MQVTIKPDPVTGKYTNHPGELPVMESFYTLQGEGHFTGHAAWFIRLAGCNVGCTWCDVKPSWEVNQAQFRKIGEIADEACSTSTRMAVITGGEPCMHDLFDLTRSLKEKGFRTHLETSGARSVTGTFDWICVSPKKFRKPLAETMLQAHELKVVVYHPSDFEWASAQAEQTNHDCMLYLQPEHSRFESMMPLILDYIRKHPQWKLSLQTHKFIGIP